MPDTQYRRLAAIMFSDIVGYSALMQESEEKAFRILEKNRNLHKSLIDLYHGKYLKEIGDGTLAVFDAASDAVKCARELQRISKEDPDLKLHVGIHLGEVIFSENDVFGDGVNIASRIDAVAKEGEIYISEDVWKNIQNKEGVHSEYLGKQKFKNIKEPIGLYRLSEEPGRSNRRRIMPGRKIYKIVPLAALLLAVLATLYFIYPLLKFSQKTTTDNSIAVIPFKNIVGSDEGAYFADGVTEAIRSNLSKVSTLKVVSGISAAQYQNRDKSASQIASELNVVYLLEGSAQKFGNSLQITVELINAVEDNAMWSNVYQRELTDLFRIQAEIANEVATAMEASITSDEYERITDVPTGNLDAYDLYIQGRYLWNKRTEEDLLKSLDYFREAIAIDPEFYLAWSGIADAFNMLCGYGYIGSLEGHAEALAAAERALEIYPESAEAYAALGWARAFRDYDWEASLDAFEQAINFEPSYATAHSWYAWMLTIQHDFDKAREHINLARTLDPLSKIILGSAGFIFYSSGDYGRAGSLLKTGIEMDPGFPRFHLWMGYNYMAVKQYDSALYHLERSVELSERHPQYLSCLGFCYGRVQDIEKANQILEEIMLKADNRYVTNYDIGVALLGANQNDLAMEYFEKSYENRDIWLPFMSVDKRFIYLYDHSEFQKIMQKAGLPIRPQPE